MNRLHVFQNKLEPIGRILIQLLLLSAFGIWLVMSWDYHQAHPDLFHHTNQIVLIAIGLGLGGIFLGLALVRHDHNEVGIILAVIGAAWLCYLYLKQFTPTTTPLLWILVLGAAIFFTECGVAYSGGYPRPQQRDTGSGKSGQPERSSSAAH